GVDRVGGRRLGHRQVRGLRHGDGGGARVVAAVAVRGGPGAEGGGVRQGRARVAGVELEDDGEGLVGGAEGQARRGAGDGARGQDTGRARGAGHIRGAGGQGVGDGVGTGVRGPV